MNLHSIRYMFEHRMLPQGFFEEKARFIGMLLQDKGVLYRIINDIFEKEEVQNPYEEEQFGIEAAKITEDVMMLKIIFPEPEEEPLCYCSYMFFDKDFEKIRYFCIEKGNGVGQPQPFVCSWDKDGTHLNHGNCTFEEHGDFKKCADIYMKQEYDMEN